MVGHISGLGYSQRFGSDGRPLAGCKLYIYDGGTSTPASVFTDYAVSISHSHPIVADAAGIIPMFWVADGTYRVRLTTADGVEVFDDDGIVALGPSSGASAGSSVDQNALFDTGDFLWNALNTTRNGWVRANGRTIGSAASGGTERAAADTEELFLYLWNNFSNTLCPVTGGRGANAAADWASNKSIATLDMRGRGVWGLDDMGNTAAGVVAGETSAGQANGAETVTVAQANLPSVNFTITATAATHTHTFSGTTSTVSNDHTHTFSGTTSTDGAHTHTTNANTGSMSNNYASSGGNNPSDKDTATVNSGGSHSHTYSGTTSGISANHTHTYSGTTAASGALTVTGTAASGGSGTALDNMPPCRHGTWYIKL